MSMVMSDAFAHKVADVLQDVIASEDWDDGLADLAGGVRRIESYEEAMMLTSDAGLVLHFADGSEARLTIRATRPRELEEDQ